MGTNMDLEGEKVPESTATFEGLLAVLLKTRFTCDVTPCREVVPEYTSHNISDLRFSNDSYTVELELLKDTKIN
jgi:hypothetical protein